MHICIMHVHARSHYSCVYLYYDIHIYVSIDIYLYILAQVHMPIPKHAQQSITKVTLNVPRTSSSKYNMQNVNASNYCKRCSNEQYRV